jgi:hypothetical protein
MPRWLPKTDDEYFEFYRSKCIITENGCWEWQGHTEHFRNQKPGQRHRLVRQRLFQQTDRILRPLQIPLTRQLHVISLDEIQDRPEPSQEAALPAIEFERFLLVIRHHPAQGGDRQVRAVEEDTRAPVIEGDQEGVTVGPRPGHYLAVAILLIASVLAALPALDP